MTSSPPARRFDWSNLALRVASAVVLVPAVLAAIWYGGGPFLLMIAIAIGLMAVEWGKMSTPEAPAEIAVTITVAVLAAVFAAQVGWYRTAWGLMVGGALIAAFITRRKVERAADAAYGVIYIAPACIALVWLRNPSAETMVLVPGQPIDWRMSQGVGWMLLLFVITWAADIFAFLVGSLLKGPKLWPRFSPNKTWSGFFGGLLGAMAAAVAFAAYTPLNLVWYAAATVGLLGGLATMAGDLWESMLKRRFGVKDSGAILPGHGGMLDRVDGLLFATIVIAAARVVDHWGWVH
ncbi:MAG TPA: phosphatidate cytidylyltransferase [Caulobacter sp.]|nr:phosphatidate cytidylyltransferase [Caulobacter sp.]